MKQGWVISQDIVCRSYQSIIQSERASSEEIHDLLPWQSLLHQNSPFSWLRKHQWSSYTISLSSTESWSTNLVHFVAFTFIAYHCWVFDQPEHRRRWENQSKRISLGKRSANKDSIEEGLEEILATSAWRSELLTHSDSPLNKCVILTLLYFWNCLGDFLTGTYIFPFT